jgi:hypothetical protein
MTETTALNTKRIGDRLTRSVLTTYVSLHINTATSSRNNSDTHVL